jgi:hypothetical protein
MPPKYAKKCRDSLPPNYKLETVWLGRWLLLGGIISIIGSIIVYHFFSNTPEQSFMNRQKLLLETIDRNVKEQRFPLQRPIDDPFPGKNNI